MRKEISNELNQHLDNPIYVKTTTGTWFTGILKKVGLFFINVELFRDNGEYDGCWNYPIHCIEFWSFDDPALHRRLLNKVYIQTATKDDTQNVS